MRRPRRAAGIAGPSLGLALGIAIVAACQSAAVVFECQSDAQCGGGGQCQATQYCSFPDAGCASGQRYSELSGSGLAGTCVAQEADASGSTGRDTATSTSGTGGQTTLSLDGSTGATQTGSASSGAASDGVQETESASADTSSETGSTGCPDLVDEFDARQLDDAWEVATNDPDTISVVDGELRFEITPLVDEWAEVRYVDTLDLTSGTTSFHIATAPQQGPSQLAMTLAGGAGYYAVLVENSMLFLRIDPGDGGGYQDLLVTEFDPIQHSVLRVSGKDGSLQFDASADGARWQELLSVPAQLPLDAITLQLGGNNWDPILMTETVAVGRWEYCANRG